MALESARSRYRVRLARSRMQDALSVLGAARLAVCDGELGALLAEVRRLPLPEVVDGGTRGRLPDGVVRDPALVHALVEGARGGPTALWVGLGGMGVLGRPLSPDCATNAFLGVQGAHAPALGRSAGRAILGRPVPSALLPEGALIWQLRASVPDVVRVDTSVGVALRASDRLARTATRLVANARTLAATTVALRPVLAQHAARLRALADRGGRRLGFQDQAALRTALDAAWAAARLIDQPLVDGAGHPRPLAVGLTQPVRSKAPSARGLVTQNIIPHTT